MADERNMDEQTERLRDIFVDVTDEDTVTESQAEERGSLAGSDETAVDRRLDEAIDQLRDREPFETALPDDALRRIVRGFYDGETDATIAAAIGSETGTDVDEETVFHARMDLHLLDEDDTDFPFDLAALRAHLADDGAPADPDARPDVDPTDVAEQFDTDAATVQRALRVLDTRDAIRRASHRYQAAFEDALPEAAISVQLTESVADDGLEEATEDIETDTKF